MSRPSGEGGCRRALQRGASGRPVLRRGDGRLVFQRGARRRAIVWQGAALLAIGASIGAAGAVGAGGAIGAVDAKSGTGSATASSEGLTVTLTATPDRVERGALVELRLTAHAKHARGALAYTLAYGDGSDAPPIVIPEFCIGGNPPPASASWRFSHRYRSQGVYRVSAEVSVNCGGGHVHVSLPVHVR